VNIVNSLKVTNNTHRFSYNRPPFFLQTTPFFLQTLLYSTMKNNIHNCAREAKSPRRLGKNLWIFVLKALLKRAGPS